MPKFYKILREDLTHHGFKYQLGLNIDTVPFNPTGECRPGGLYYTDIDHIFRYSKYGSLIAEVEPVGKIYEENGKIVSECDSDDLDVLFWHRIPKPPIV
jgi:hypothetical protein